MHGAVGISAVHGGEDVKYQRKDMTMYGKFQMRMPLEPIQFSHRNAYPWYPQHRRPPSPFGEPKDWTGRTPKGTFLSGRKTFLSSYYNMPSQSWQVRCPLRSQPVEDFRLICGLVDKICRLFNERLLRWRGGSVCCAVSCRYRNAFRLFRKMLCASLLRLWAGKECLTPPGRRGAREGRAGQESLERAPSRSDGYTIIPTS
jgi:hypothetical protein